MNRFLIPTRDQVSADNQAIFDNLRNVRIPTAPSRGWLKTESGVISSL